LFPTANRITIAITSRIGPDRGLANHGTRRLDMLGWTLTFLIIAVIAAAFGFGGIAVAAAGIAKILFYIFLVLFLVSLVGSLARRA
jgi:uncharacterized membrane protein YtjA (UPF0391 family)